MERYFGEFSSYLREKKTTINTIEAYERDVLAFLNSLKLYGVKSFHDYTASDAKQYIDMLSSSGKAASTVARNLASLRGFYKFLMLKGYTDFNPFAKIDIQKAEKKLPSVLTGREVEKLLAQPDTTGPKGIRDRAMLELLYATGLRVSELIELDLENINLDMGYVRCVFHDEERIIPIYPMAVKSLSVYIDNVRKIYCSEDTRALFLNFGGERLTRQGFWKIIKQYQQSAGIKTTITPQTLRHSFAAHLIENGADLKDVQEMLGHSDIASTQVYARFVKNKFKSIYSKYHPRA